MRTILKRTAICICIAMILLSATLAAVHLYLATEPGARRMMAIINSFIPGTISGRSISVSLLDQTAAINDATLSGPDGRIILEASRVDVSLDLPELLSRRLVFNAIRLERPAVILAIEADGQLNIVSAFKENTSQKSSLEVFIKSLQGTNGTLAFRLKDGTELVRMQGLKLKLVAAFTADVILHLSVPSARPAFRLSGREIAFGAGSFSFSLKGDRIDDIRISMQKNSSLVSLSGLVSDLSGKALLNAHMNLDADPADFSKDLGFKGHIDGRISGSITATGVYENPNVSCILDYHGKIPHQSTPPLSKSGRPSIRDVSFSGTISDRELTCRSLKLNFARGTAFIKGSVDLRPVFPRLYFGGRNDWTAVTYDLGVSGNGIRLADLPGAMRGTLGADLAVKGHGIKPKTLSADISGTTWVAGFSAGTLKKTDLRLTGRGAFRGETIYLDPVRASADGSTLTAHGTVNLASRAIGGAIDLNAPRIERLPVPYAIGARGAVSAKAMLSGTIERPAARVTLNGEACAWKDAVLGEVRLDASLDRSGTVTINSGTITNKASRIKGSGTLGIFSQFPNLNRSLPVRIAADLESVNPLDFSQRPRLAGAFSGSITASGDRSSLIGDLMISGNDCIYAGMPLGLISLEARLKEGILSVDRFGLEKGRSSLNASGTVRVLKENALSAVKDPDINLMITKGLISLKDFSDEASGDVALSGAIQGTVRHLRGTASLAGKDLDLGIQKLAGLDLNARFEEDRIWIEPVRAVISTDQVIQGTGWLSLDGEYDLEASSPGIALTSLDYLKKRPELSGTAGIEISGRGSLERPRISGKLSLKGLSYQDKALPDGSLSLNLIDHRLSVTGDLGFDFTGSYDLQTREYEAAAAFNRTDLAPVFALADKASLSGAVSGTIKAGGRIDRPQDTAVDADLSALAISQENKLLVQADTITGSYRNGTLVLPVTHVRLAESGKLDVSGSGTLREGLVFNAEGTVPLEVIGAFVKEFDDAGGTISFSSQVRSRDVNTGVKALFTLENCTYTIPYNGQRIRALNGLIRMEDGLVSFSGVAGKLESGSFTINGTAALEGYTRIREMDVRAQAKAVPLELPDMMDLTLDADATLSIVSHRPQLKADVVILDGEYYKDVNTNLLTGVIEGILPQRKPVMSQAAHIPSFLKDMTLDVDIKRRGEMKIDNNLAVLELNPDLKVTGTVQAPVINGRISVTEGTVTFQNNTFTVSRGVIDFLNPHKTEASLDIMSQTKVRDWTISLTLEGPIDNLKIHLNSQPAEEQSDILSLLVLGKTTRELTQQQAGVKVSPSIMVAELMTSTYGTQIKKATSIDILKLEYSSLSTKDTGSNLKFTVGKELSSHITISYEMETKNSETTRWGVVSYKLFDSLLVNGYPGTNGNFGAEVQVKHEFR
jgi:translocation and assembly module TamB